VHASEKSLRDLGDKVESAERARIEAAIADVREAIKGDSKSTIEAKLKVLGEASAGLAQRVYGAQEGAEQPGGAAGAGGSDGGNDNVVDAEFEEVKDDKKSA
jgi:molecular chaperone DnaK